MQQDRLFGGLTGVSWGCLARIEYADHARRPTFTRFRQAAVKSGFRLPAGRTLQLVFVPAGNAAALLALIFPDQLQAIHGAAAGADGAGDKARPSQVDGSNSLSTGATSGRTPRHSSNASAAWQTSMPIPSAVMLAPAAAAQRQNAV